MWKKLIQGQTTDKANVLQRYRKNIKNKSAV